MKKLLLSIFIIFLFASSCKKDNCGRTMQDIAGKYHLIKVIVANETYPTGLSICERERVYDLKPNGTVDLYVSSPCPGSNSGTWGFTSAGKLFINAGYSYTVNGADIVSFDCTTLELDDPQVPYSPRYRFTFERK